MSDESKKIDTSLLIKLGLKEALLSKLSEEQIRYLISYTMNYSNNPEVSRNLSVLASLELNGKEGSAFLASEGLATIAQLKILDSNQIIQLISEYIDHHNSTIVMRMIKEFIVLEQQDKMYNKTNGLKGEYVIYNGHRHT